jgi:hypothetical protein
MSKPMMAVTTTVFLLACSVILSTFTGANVQETFFGTAGFVDILIVESRQADNNRYAAVTIMFLCNLNQGFSPSSG